MLKFKHLLPAFYLMFLSNTLSGQSNLFYSIGGGAMFYNGDLSDYTFLPPGGVIRPYVSADVNMWLVDRVDLSLRYLHGSITGDDAYSTKKYNLARNLSFRSNIDEVSTLLRVQFFSVKRQAFINPYALVGLGIFWFKPKADYNGVTYELQPLGTEGQFIEGGGYAEPYKLHSSCFAAGVGLYFKINEQFAVRLEAAPQFTFTDYLDDTSTIYPDSTELANTPNGAIAVLFSSRLEKGFPKKGKERGNSGKDDVFITVGLSLVYTPEPWKRQNSKKPGVLNQVFKKKKGWWGQSPD